MPTLLDAQEALLDEDIDRAEAICLELVAQDVSATEANYILAQLAIRAGDREKAHTYLESAYTADPTDLDVIYQLAEMAVLSKKWADVVIYCEQLVKIPDQGDLKKHCIALWNLIVGLLQLNRREDAIAPARHLNNLLQTPHLQEYMRRATRGACFPVLAMVLRDNEIATGFFRRRKLFRSRPATAVVADVVTTRQWCLENGEIYQIVDAPQEMVVHCGSGGLDEWRYRSSGTFFARIPGGGMVPRWDFALTPDGRVLSDSGYRTIERPSGFLPHHSEPILFPSTIIRPMPKNTESIDEDVLFLSSPLKFHPTHWMIDYLPRLRGLSLASGSGMLKVAIPTGLPQRNRDFLKYFGISESDVILCRDDTSYTFRNLHVFGLDSSDRPIPANVEFVGNALRGGLKRTPRRGARYYLTRESVGNRNVRNIESFNPLMTRHGFETVDIAVLSVDDQISKIGDAEMLLGPTGSNLIAAYYAPQGCPVIELIPHPSHNESTGRHCRFLGAAHEFFLCEPVYRDELQSSYDLIVDCDSLDKLIRKRLDIRA